MKKTNLTNIFAGIGACSILLVSLLVFTANVAPNSQLALTLGIPPTRSTLPVSTKPTGGTTTGTVAQSPNEDPICGYQSSFGSRSDFPFGYGIASGANGNVIVTNVGNGKIKIVDTTKNTIKDLGTVGSGSSGVVTDKAGNIYVTYTSEPGKSVEMFNSQGVSQKAWNSYLDKGKQVFFVQPSAIAIDPSLQKAFYIAQIGVKGPSSIGIFYLVPGYDAALVKYVGTNGSGKGKYASIGGMAVDGASNLFVVDTNSNKVIKYLANGGYSEFGVAGTKDGQFNKPSGIAIAPNGDVYVVDTGNNRIQIFDQNGNFKSKFGYKGTDGGGFNSPVTISFGSQGEFYVMDQVNFRLQKFAKACATVKVVKNTTPTNTKEFDFWLNIQSQGFKLKSGASTTFDMMKTSQTVTETADPRYDSSASCNTGSTALGIGERIDYFKNNKETTAKLTLSRGQNVTCTFTNKCLPIAGQACPEVKTGGDLIQ